jgi:AcrR family transcriptional regulator
LGKQDKPTKQRILDSALTLFSAKGYESVTVAEIADAVGIKAPSLYKHYKSKHDIFEAIITEMDARYESKMSSMLMDGRKAERDMDAYANISVDALVDIGEQLFSYYLHDEYARKFRKILMLEQYADRALADIFVRRYYDAPLDYQGESFRILSEMGRLAPEDSRIMALHFYAPIFLLLTLCDAHPEMEREALEMNERHIRQFVRVYGKHDTGNK